MSRIEISRGVTRSLISPRALLKAKEESAGGNGWIEGYGSVFGNIDQQGEIMQRGCFARSLRTQIAARKVKLMTQHFAHGGDVAELIGTITNAREDEVGLWIHAELSGVQLAQDTRKKILEKHVTGLSVGFAPLEWEVEFVNGREVVVHTEVKLLEVTVTARPANELCEINNAKALSTSKINPAVMQRQVRQYKETLRELEQYIAKTERESALQTVKNLEALLPHLSVRKF